MKFPYIFLSYSRFLSLAFACLVASVAYSATDDEIQEKHTRVAMRMIGHEVLKSLGDENSRVMPIENINGQYKIPFEFDFSFEPEELVAIIEKVMKETELTADYLVEVEQCDSKEVVYSYLMGNENFENIVPCGGRSLPKNCYSLLIANLEENSPLLNPKVGKALPFTEVQNDNRLRNILLTIPFLLLIGLIGYRVLKGQKETTIIDPNLVSIGEYRFDTKNSTLSINNESVELSNKEAALLSILHSSANEPLKRDTILQKVWGDEGDYVGRTLDVFISKLRKKLAFDETVKIVNIRGVGYKLVFNV